MQPLLLTAKASLRVFSYGGGVQSNAVLALQAAGKLLKPYDLFIFANVGDDSENPATLQYINEVAKPFAEKHGIQFVEVQKTRRGGEKETLKGHIFRTRKSVPIPAFMGGNGSPGNRTCTTDFKIGVVDRWIKKEKYPAATIGIGISLDEFHRMRPHMTHWSNVYQGRKIGFWKRLEYVLIDNRISRKDCKRIIAEAGLPPAPKSSCYFCPFKKRTEWLELKRESPELFAEAVKIDNHIREKRDLIGKDAIYIHPDLVPLENAVGNQAVMFTNEELDMCETGFCFV